MQKHEENHINICKVVVEKEEKFLLQTENLEGYGKQ